MATSAVQICNSALIKVGADVIISLSDDNKRARILNHQYEILRDEVLRSHPWNFAIARIECAEISPAPDTGEFDHWFQLPSDCLRVLNIVDQEGLVWVKEADRILANTDELVIRYIKRVTDTTIYDANFSEVLATRIASDLAWSLVQNEKMSKTLMETYLGMLRPARSFDAQEGSVTAVKTSSWINSRY